MFFQPTTVLEVKDLLADYKNAKLLAGGTDLLLEIKRDKINPKYLIDISHVDSLKEITDGEDEITIGSMVTFSQLLENPLIKTHFHSLIECAKGMGSPQIRNMATIGGNIINAQAAADSIPCIMSLDGVLVIESQKGIRKVSCESYFEYYSQERIKDDEILTKVILPKSNGLTGFYKLGKRNSLAIARMITSIYLSVENEIIKEIALCLGAVGKFPFRVKEIEREAIGKRIDWLYSEEPLNLLENSVYESIKERKSMPFKKEAIKGVYKAALKNVGWEDDRSDN
ncbi:FAD binding domain-containing protein [Mycoplasmatota bacterium]|nr:FAD binding domain-containing protein [Mycoplasmatota bacterium]